jgi:hypothetical protein
VRILLEDTRVQINLTGPEARVLLEELAHVRGGSRMPKLRQVCAGLEALFMLTPKGKKKANDQRI